MFAKLRSTRIFTGVVAAGLLLPALTPATALAAGGLLSTRHNLSTSGKGEVKATQEERVCIFCHTPHHASPVTPLWSRPTSSTVYDLYQSSTLLAKPGQPSGASRLCLSCHDGTIALGALYGLDSNSGIQMAGGLTRLPVSSASNLGGSAGSDLTNDHPISFAYTVQLAQSNGQLKSPAELPPKIRLEEGVLLQCTSCHNPHRNPYGSFLVVDNTHSALCTSCHQITGWSASGHALNSAVAAKGCGNCHPAHNGISAEFELGKPAHRLLKNKAEEQNCLPCHQNGGSGKDIQSELTKAYTHPVSRYAGVHDEAENPLTAQKHVECEDCHNPHQGKSAAALPPAVNGTLLGVKGISVAKTATSPSSYEYEICFRCHADNNFTAIQTVVRRIQELNTRLQFSSRNPSYHPVTAQGAGLNVPSLRPEYSTGSMIYCSDCHGSDDSLKAGGTAPNGPHGSIYPHILMARYETDSYPLSYQESNYALCYRCHDQRILLDPSRSAFPRHRSHVMDRGIPCSVCHDAHGVTALDGATPSANAHLINFDTRVVTSGTGYDSAARTCAVNCHSAPHSPY